MQIVLFPTLRIRDTMRVSAVIDVVCLGCDFERPVDVIALACRHGLQCSVMRAIEGVACPLHGEDGIRYRAVGAPAAPYYFLHLGALVEPSCSVVAHCGACHRERSIDVVELARHRRIEPDVLLVNLADRMRCSGCGQVGWVRFRLIR